MILTAGLIAGTFAFHATATPLQPMQIERVSNTDTRVYAGEDMVLHLSHTQKFETIVYDVKAKQIMIAVDGMDETDVLLRKGQTVDVNAATGFEDGYYKIGNHKIYVNGVK